MRVAAATLLLVLAPAVVLAQSAQAPPDLPLTAILQAGPEQRRGIDALAPDVTAHWYGRYSVGAAAIEIRWVPTAFEQPAGWARAQCPERELRVNQTGLHYYAAGSRWSLFATIVSGELPAGVTICAFVDGFVTRHLVFQRLPGIEFPGSEPVFPAVIEL